jgi:hypothetical protein
MAIICFEADSKRDGFHHTYGSEPKAWPEGAYCPVGEYNNSNDREQRQGWSLVLWQEYVGCCLYEWEVNGSWDSDFYMMVWDHELKMPKPICFASTRGWSYPAMGSKPDATPEVLALYQEYKAEQAIIRAQEDRIVKAKFLRTEHTLELKLTARYGFTVKALRQWKRMEDPARFERAYALLKSTKLRNEFRKKLQAQLAEWLKDKDKKFKSPFSFKQWEYV